MNIVQLKKAIREMQHGEEFETNAISFSENAILELRRCIKEGVIQPINLKNRINDAYLSAYMDGTFILPQGEYRKV